MASIAQTRIGLMGAPVFSYGRPEHPEEYVKNTGSKTLIRFGLEFDFMMSDSYAFSTGLIYSPERLSITYNDGTTSFDEAYKVQYLQIPVTLKLFTSELQPDLKAYFQIGFIGEILLNNEPLDNDYYLIEDFKFYDFSFTGGAGIEYGPGVNTIIYGGVFYDHGLVNIVKTTSDLANGNISAKMSAFSIKVGLKF